MYQEERLEAIIDYLRTEKRISIEQICSIYQVSRDTARRDLVKLEEIKAVIRTRGGAILPSAHHKIRDYTNRLKHVSAEKERIGKKAASLILSGDRVILDSSTTVQACAESLSEEDCTVITNSIHQAGILAGKRGIQIHLLGGELQKEHGFLYGSAVLDKLANYHVEKAFIGLVGISEHGLTIAHEEDGMVKRRMLKQAEQVIILADHSKMEITDFFKFADLSEIDIVITDREPSENMMTVLEKNHVELLIADTEETG
ncbi:MULTISPECIES: DeoR/GlpR family DNA-binding transcription regulator [Bacillaceae]|uniref:DeoR/GlpR family DNA-binding transcription regulator n=1 Tax=Metabacillus sediminis TaxID=3117746 RepID=A0ABZ2NL11_9BACI|nr:DeoR/GlpR family DNA-binding transcription regulator [Bacillus sp. SJS]KZZ83081.1 DeoR family transcriptional regulator [Bacillus sp. SJS]